MMVPTDTSGRICDIYKDRYPDIVKVFHKPNEGLLATRRFGFKKGIWGLCYKIVIQMIY